MNKSGAERGAIKPASEDESRKKSRGDVGEFDSGTTSDDDSRKKLRGDVGEFDSGTSTVDLAGSVAKHFARRVLMRQVLVAIAAYALVLLLAPFMLMLDAQPLGELWLHAGAAGLAGTMFAAISSRAALRSGRAVLEALAFYPDRVDAGAFGALAELPYVLTLRLCAGAVVAASLTLVPALRPSRMDDARASSLALLFLIIVGAASVLCYVAVRDATLRALEIGPSGQIASWLEHEAVRLAPRRRTVRKVVLAIMAPVALVGGGALLVTHAHLRTLVEESRATTAARVARIALGGSDLRFDREAREEALAAALAHGFSIRPVARPTEPGEPASVRLPSGHVELAVALAPSEVAREPAARVRYAAELASNITAIGAVILLFSVAAAALIGRAFGTALASDLVLASQRVASLGTEAASHAADPTAERSRFAVVAELDDSVARLASRFSEFAAAQRRALRARAAAQRVKQLLFASVSHDLKNPLNAILGFAELVREEPLSSAQLESLEMVVSRGRELLRLIETILDAARVEAGQLKLAKERTSASVLVNLALEIARELVAERGSDVLVELPRDLPALSVDRTRGPLALAALIAHAMASARASSGGAVRIRGSGGKDGGGPRIWIEHADGHGQPALLASQLTGRSPSARDRGLVLRLSLARAVIELHGGRVEVGRGQRRESVVTCYWPAASGDS